MRQNVCYEYDLFTNFIENNNGDQQVTDYHKMYVASSTLTEELKINSLHLLIYTCNLHNNK
jgi:hypothetical protein